MDQPRTSADIIRERQNRLHNLGRATTVKRTFPLLIECGVANNLYAMLQQLTAHYILASLKCAYPGRTFSPAAELLVQYRDEILKLPNRTPNGKLAAKKEVAMEFNLVQKGVELVFQQLGLAGHLELMQLPVIVRIQDGRPDSAVDGRAYATSKIHSDIWTGEAADSATVIIPVLGDIHNTGVDFFEPEVPRTEDFVKTFTDYLETQKFLGAMKKYDCEMIPNCLYIFDSFCLHQTVKSGGGIRVSIDFRFLYRDKIATDVQRNWNRQTNYVPVDDWYTLERGTFLEPTGTFAEAIRKYAGGPLPPGGGGAEKEFTVMRLEGGEQH